MAQPQYTPNLAALKTQASTQYRAADYIGAAQTCQAILKLDRRDPDTQNLLATIYIQQEAFHAARKLLLDIVKAHPRAGVAICNLGVVYDKLGQSLRAQKLFEQAIKAQPNLPISYLNLARLLNTAGKNEAALKHYRKALELNPQNFDALSAAGRLCFDLEQYGEALSHWQAALALKPNHIPTLMHCGEASYLCDRFEPTLAYLERVLEQDPAYIPALLASARLHLSVDDPNTARALIDKLIEIAPHDREALLLQADCYSKMDMLKAALNIWQSLRRAYPDDATILKDQAQARLKLGDMAAARADLEQALKLQPDLSAAHFALSGLKKYTKDDPHIAELHTLLKNQDLSLSAQADLHFSLNKAYSDCKAYEPAFHHLYDANQASRAEARRYDPAKMRAQFETIQSVHATMAAADAPCSAPADRNLIFIVGMPRSGTTLTEQILSSHSQVYGAGELNDLNRLYQSIIARTDALSTEALLSAHQTVRTAYLASLSERDAIAPAVTDKMPANFRYVGAILQMFPGAKIVHLQRDARAVCWSIYKRHFGSEKNSYATDFDTIADYYSLYRDYIAFWKAQYPSQIYDLEYASLTQQQYRETANLLDYCDLEWQDACMNFTANARAVLTASHTQVRQKMYTGSSEAWRAYAPQLQPMLDALAKYNIPLPD